MSGLVELKLEQTYPTLPSEGIAQLRVYNGELCDYSITTNFADLSFDVNSLDKYINKSINIESSNGINIQFQFNAKAGATCALLPNHNCLLKSERSYYMILNSKNTTHPIICAEDTIAKPSRGYPLVRVLANVNPCRTIQWQNSKGSVEHTEQAYQRSLMELNSDTYLLLVDNVEIDMVKFEVGGIYTILIAEESSSTYHIQVVTVTEPNSVSIFRLIPQYVVMSLGQVTFTVTGTEFSYTEAPVSMKTVLQGFWLLTRCFGNLIVIK
ncbi:solute carrier family 15 member 1-like [Eurosta solidaginis]|uniref:solute carrier family 15 member 1-like n=1 Tax=Eurosta solidaginis TaxID=178769 RepID=UPI003530B249